MTFFFSGRDGMIAALRAEQAHEKDDLVWPKNVTNCDDGSDGTTTRFACAVCASPRLSTGIYLTNKGAVATVLRHNILLVLVLVGVGVATVLRHNLLLVLVLVGVGEGVGVGVGLGGGVGLSFGGEVVVNEHPHLGEFIHSSYPPTWTPARDSNT